MFVRATEAAARATCAAAEPFACDSLSVCGTGSCRFSHDQLRTLVVPDAPTRSGKDATRVQLNQAGQQTTYFSEAAVLAFRDRDTVEPGTDAA